MGITKNDDYETNFAKNNVSKEVELFGNHY
jgi:hypothetical protein